MTIRRMRVVYWVTKATDTLRICNTFVFLWQQWFRERASMLLCTYIFCLVVCFMQFLWKQKRWSRFAHHGSTWRSGCILPLTINPGTRKFWVIGLHPGCFAPEKALPLRIEQETVWSFVIDRGLLSVPVIQQWFVGCLTPRQVTTLTELSCFCECNKSEDNTVHDYVSSTELVDVCLLAVGREVRISVLPRQHSDSNPSVTFIAVHGRLSSCPPSLWPILILCYHVCPYNLRGIEKLRRVNCELFSIFVMQRWRQIFWTLWIIATICGLSRTVVTCCVPTFMDNCYKLWL
jgi:hypothetical protein